MAVFLQHSAKTVRFRPQGTQGTPQAIPSTGRRVSQIRTGADPGNGYDLTPFLNPDCNPVTRYQLLAKAAEFVFASNDQLNTESRNGKSVSLVTFKTYFLKTVKRMRMAYDICQPSGELDESESALAQCFMAIAGFVRKMSGTDAPDTDTMNRNVARMVEEALKYNEVESILDSGEEENLFSPEFIEKLADVKMPATKLEMLVKALRKQIKEYSKTNQMAAKKYQDMLEATIQLYHERRKHHRRTRGRNRGCPAGSRHLLLPEQ